MDSCLFCKIIEKKIPSSIVFEDELCIGFKDINPIAPTHVLFIPKKHIESLNDIISSDESIVGHILGVVSRYAKEQNLDKTGYRVVNNMGKDGGQTVFHLHFHLVGGKSFGWPPG
ncbi:MAG: histidine triad nucleotide-binding protein [Leptospiraceae bacterium]|nr:histidine triad nucleotide-binding protein [Leptospiraceae bacterium]